MPSNPSPKREETRRELATHLVDDLLETPNERAREALIDMVNVSLNKFCSHEKMCNVCCRPCVVDAEIKRRLQ